MRVLSAIVTAVLVSTQYPARAVGSASATVSAAADSPRGTGVAPYHTDVVVTDASGAAVDDLTAADFQIFEDGATRPIDSARLVKADGPVPRPESLVPISSRADEEAEAARDSTRLLAVFLDEYHVTPGEGVARARQMLGQLVDRRLSDRDLLATIKPLDSLLNLRLGHDHRASAGAITAFEGRRGDYAPRTEFEANYIAASPSRIEGVRTQIVTSALNALAVHLGSLGPGRKTIILVSEGFQREGRRRGDEPLPTLDTVIRSANRGGVSIYAIDPLSFVTPATAALSPAEVVRLAEDRSADRDTLRSLADETAGAAMLVPADVQPVTRRIVGDSTAYYVVTFRPAHGEDVGKFHAVEVRVHRPGVVVRARKGYWTPSIDERLRATIAARAAEPKPPLPQALRMSPLIRPWFGVSRGRDGNVHVSFVWEPAVRVPGDRVRQEPPARVAVKAIRDGATIFQGDVRPSAPTGGERQDGTPSEATFTVAPGRLRVQMSIEDGSLQVIDTDVRDVMVATLAGPVAIGTPKVLRARNAREYREEKENPDFAPVAAREFSRTERLLVRFPAYGDDGPPLVTARVLARSGSAMRQLTVETRRDDVREVDLPLAAFAPGEYILEIVAKAGRAESKETLRFRVTS